MMKLTNERCERFENVASNNPFQMGSRRLVARGRLKFRWDRAPESHSFARPKLLPFQREQPGSANHPIAK